MPTMQPHLLHWDNNDLSRTKTWTQPNCERRRGRHGYSQQQYHVHRDGDWVKSREVGICIGVMEVVLPRLYNRVFEKTDRLMGNKLRKIPKIILRLPNICIHMYETGFSN
jgi:hypothetical protein